MNWYLNKPIDNQTFGHFIKCSVYYFTQRFLGQIERLVVPSDTKLMCE
jgi:hypothetical protein